MRPMRSSIAVLIGLLLVAPSAWAGKPDHPGGKYGGHGGSSDGGNVSVGVSVQFSLGQRNAYDDWYGHQYGRSNCPPGLAKKHNGCLPPGQAKKRYAVGAPLPPDVVVLDLPIELSRELGPPPHGYRYGIIDGDVVKLAVGTLLVVDALQGLSH